MRRATLLERPVQRGAIELLAMFGLRAVHVPNGAHLAGDKLSRAKQVAKLKADGMAIGFVDLIVFGRHPLEIGFLEAKREKGGGLSEDQEGWRDFIRAQGFPWALFRLPEEALAAVRGWGWLGRASA